MRIRAVWSESSLDAFWITKDAKFHHADNEDSYQIARMRRLIWVFVGAHVRRYIFSRYGAYILFQLYRVTVGKGRFVNNAVSLTTEPQVMLALSTISMFAVRFVNVQV